MIPIRLTLSNFLSYRKGAPTLDFTGIHVACLCGPNGHGKSALLDAITWCLWGKARGKSQDELIFYGADQAKVELDFEARATHYRVVRTYARGGGRRRQGVSDLQLQVISGSGGLQAITGNQIRETQAKIDQIVGMDYDTFINSAFLLQGRADEFTNKTPSERKAVLAKILGLEFYDRLQDRAKERLSESSESLREVDGAVGEMKRQIDEIGDPSGELAGVDANLSRLNAQLKESRIETAELVGAVGELERQLSQLEEVGQQIQTLRSEIKQLESAVQTSGTRIKEFKLVLDQGDAIKQGSVRLDEARRSFEALEAAGQTVRKLSDTKVELERTIERARARLDAQAEQLRLKVEVELPAKARAEPELMDQQERAQEKLNSLDEEERAVLVSREEHQTLSTRVGEAQSVAERYKVEGQELVAKLELLRSTSKSGAMCPLCRTPLGEDGCGRLSETYEIDIAKKRQLYVLNASQLKQLENDRSGLEKDLARREKAATQSRRALEAKISELDRAVSDARLAQKELAEAGIKLGEVAASLESGDFAATEHAELQQLESKIEALGYDEAARGKAYSQVQELQPFAEQTRRLAEAERSLPLEQESDTQTRVMLERRRGEVERLAARHANEQLAVTNLPHWRSKLEEAERKQRALEGESQGLTARRGFLAGQALRLNSLTREMAKGSARLSELRDDQSVYQELVTAFGRQGVQAMLIETVVPRLEEEANSLLGRMTDNRMSVSLATQRERRSGRGDPIETLEIVVRDELGPRSYEMYSGGEAFRVNLALRIALSKVLAQRMGTPLPTLFIDEGFGTQDAAGRERILDVIGAIQDDFEKIIVITHLDELKDAFPVRIEVQKDENGSTFWLS